MLGPGAGRRASPTLTVSATQPVDVEEDSQAGGRPGVVSSTGFPLDP